MWHFYPDHYMFSYQVVRMASQSLFGGGEFNEILEAAGQIKPGDYESFHRAWAGLGHRVLSEANKALDEGHTITARAAFLRAANYFRSAEFFLTPDDPRKLPTYKAGIHAFRMGAAMLDNPPKQVEIPYEDSFLPGYFFQAPNQENGPLVIMFGGLDSTAEELYFGPAQLLNERGISLLAVDGPGQGGALRLNHIHTRYDYNVAGTAALDFAIEQLPIDAERVAVMAVSMGGYMAARCAAFEPRFKACAIWSAVYSYYDVWARRPDDHPLSKIAQHIAGVDSMAEAREKFKTFTLQGVAENIKVPTYIVHGEDDRQVPVDHAYRVYNDLVCPRTLVVVPVSSSGSSHCQVDNVTKTYPMYDWLQKQLQQSL
ncbi:alpha/beta hydrolase family protein [Paenibacillus sp.]|uniref:alpha/beta hydrolase family protein n=1 Tax=Paenibacillus sp. TaxID=58172 RepID=UPI002D5ED7D8|nr:prolyl oligopeptidase family serine peptidase [Paenibacillus sp.]HZG84046.1 prolyl oligopeptidase family serine peptidase [Paenibacillus sp.]